jgi:Holliday junction resolvasome RuvABC endonuclease subunit
MSAPEAKRAHVDIGYADDAKVQSSITALLHTREREKEGEKNE